MINNSEPLPPLTLRVQLTVIDELGINLYSNTPAVLSELVANAWDADANNVWVTIDVSNKIITIEDDGCGMNREDLQQKYLNVGYRKRGLQGQIDLTPKGRSIMGRKGIGKLSIFAISNRARIETVKLDETGQSTFQGGAVLSIDEIRNSALKDKDYEPTELSESDVGISKGTQITLTEISKGLSQAVKALRTRIARRFSVIGTKENFTVWVNGQAVSAVDRDYFHKLQYVYWIGDEQKSLYRSACTNLETEGDIIQSAIELPQFGTHAKITGWIGFAKETKQMTDPEGDSLNRVILMVRGKLAQEDLLPLISENRVGKSYLMGEIHADFLDDTNQADIAVASRQGIKENDERYSTLIHHISTIIKSIVSNRDKQKETKTENDLLKNDVIKEWVDSIDEKDRSFAKKMLRSVSKASEIDPATKETMVKHTIVAFEQLRYSNRIQELDHSSDIAMENLVEIFGDISRLEAAMYSEIAIGRIKAIEKLQQLIDNNAKEQAFQGLLGDNPWLLDTSWERATDGDVIVERNIKNAWGAIQNADDLENGRVDITYRIVSGVHLIIELKRSNRTVSSTEVQDQVKKYVAAFKAAMKDHGDSNPRYQVRLVVGKPLEGWDGDTGLEDQDRKAFAVYNIEVCYYGALASSARKSYKEYLEKQHKINGIRNILDRLQIA